MSSSTKTVGYWAALLATAFSVTYGVFQFATLAIFFRRATPAVLTLTTLILLLTADNSAQQRVLVEAGAGFSAPAGELARRQEFGTAYTLPITVGLVLAL